MNNLEWLLNGDSTISFLTRKYLLEEKVKNENEGLIKAYLNIFDRKTKTWGNGYYGPKWISTNYTLLELKYLEISPDNENYSQALLNYLDHFWHKYIQKNGIESMDMCITGMLISLISYAKINKDELFEMIDYILAHPMNDGGFNCLWNHQKHPKISSVHTTINVLEGLADYINNGYLYRIEEVKDRLNMGINCLLDRELIFIKNTKTPIHPEMAKHHFPPRWKYDYLRVLEFLAKQNFPCNEKIEPTLSILINNLKKGKLTKGSQISGLIHFPLEKEKYGRFNTLRAYIVLKQYKPKLYNELIHQTYE